MAKKEKAEKTKAAKPTGHKLSGKTKLMLFILLVGSIAILRQSVVMLLIGMLPAIVAIIVDNTHNKAWAKTVFCFNLAGLLPSLLEVYISAGNSMTALQNSMSNMTVWLVAYGAAGAAWVVIWAAPMIAEKFLEAYCKTSIATYKRKIEKLDEEWNVSGRSSQ